MGFRNTSPNPVGFFISSNSFFHQRTESQNYQGLITILRFCYCYQEDLNGQAGIHDSRLHANG
ncbi:MAG TPA: hypothetical protein VF490_20885 [Chryseosolibacter sp.]